LRDRSGQRRDTQEQQQGQSQEAGQVRVLYGRARQSTRAGQRRVQKALTWRGDRAAEDAMAACADLTLYREQHNTRPDQTALHLNGCDADLTPPRWTTMDRQTIHSSPVVSREKLLPKPRYRRKHSAHIHTCALSKNRMHMMMRIHYIHTMLSACTDPSGVCMGTSP
jgi:hypothetical protein